MYVRGSNHQQPYIVLTVPKEVLIKRIEIYLEDSYVLHKCTYV